MEPKLPIRKTCRRYNDPYDAHELTFTCFRKQPFLGKDRTRRYLSEAILRARQMHHFDVWAYVFMPEHVHLLIWPTEEAYSISEMLRSIKQSVSRRAITYLRKHNPDGLRRLATGQKHAPYRFWMDGGGYDRNVRRHETTQKMLEYIHNNPVRRGLVTSPEEWYWSSAREWEGIGPGPVPVDKESFLFR